MRHRVGEMCSWGGGCLLVHLTLPHVAVAADLLQCLAPLLPMPIAICCAAVCCAAACCAAACCTAACCTPLHMRSLLLAHLCFPRLQLLFQNASPAYLAALEDKGIFGARRSSVTKGSATAPPPTLPAWVHMQATEYVLVTHAHAHGHSHRFTDAHLAVHAYTYTCNGDSSSSSNCCFSLQGSSSPVTLFRRLFGCPTFAYGPLARACACRFGAHEISPLALKIGSPSTDAPGLNECVFYTHCALPRRSFLHLDLAPSASREHRVTLSI
jgi:hypothetical protein